MIKKIPFIFLLIINFISNATCTLSFSSGTIINFGSYNPFATTAMTQSLGFVSNCSATPLDSDRTITISSGSNAGLPYRAMSGGTSLLNYNLYVPPGYNNIYGDGTAGTVTVLANEADGVNQIINAQIPIHQNVESGGTMYTDSVFVSIGGSPPQSVSILANVPNTCTMGGATLAFDQYDPINTNRHAPLHASTSINVMCTSGATGTITVGMENGQYYSSGKRRLLGSPSGEYLNYNIYLPSNTLPNASCSYTTIWGTSINSLLDLSLSPPSVNGESYNVCGQIDAGQNVGAGSYQDTVIMKLNF